MTKRRPSKPPAKRAALMVDEPSRRVQAARQLWNSGQQADALTLFDEAIRQEPNNVRTYVMAARAYAEIFDFVRMDAIHNKLVQRSPRHPGVHHYLGETYFLLKLPERAIDSFQQAARLPGGGPPTWMELASLYERAHRLEEAEDLIQRTIREGFDLPLVSLVRARIERRQKQLDRAELTLRGLVARITAESEWACQAWGELALMKDQQGDFPGAIEAIENCKQVQRSHEAQHLKTSQRLHSHIAPMIDAVSQYDFRRWAGDISESKRIALLTGFPRSGTTLLEQVLDAHPDLVSSEERDFFGKDIFSGFTAHRGKSSLLDVMNECTPAEIESHRKRYFAAMEYLLAEPIGARMHLDKNPSYNLIIPLMLRIFPEARLIVALRDPRDVVLSCYLRYLPLNAVSVHYLDMRRAAERYVLDMKAWLRLRELVDVPWCAIRYEDTVADLEAQARKALGVLGLDWDAAVLNYRDRLTVTKQVTSPSYEAVAQPIYTRAIGRWANYETYLEPALEVLAPFVREFGYSP